MSEALKSCPFCGGEPMLHWVRFGEPSDGDQTYIKCVDCHARSGIATNEVESNAEWNRRADAEEVKALRAEVAEAVKALEECGREIAGLRAELRRQSQELERAREIVRRIGEGHNPHRKCLAPTRCCPKNRLCFPCLANDFLAQPAQKQGEPK